MAQVKKVTRLTPRQIRLVGTVPCERIYPVEGTVKTTADLKTVGFKLNREQAIHLARVILAVTQDWQEVDITGFRLRNVITVTAVAKGA
jgi:hypothetical protein